MTWIDPCSPFYFSSKKNIKIKNQAHPSALYFSLDLCPFCIFPNSIRPIPVPHIHPSHHNPTMFDIYPGHRNRNT